MEFITTDQRIATENFRIGKIYTITFKDSSSITRACIGKGADYVMFQEEAPKMLFTLNMQTASTIDTIEVGGGGSGTTDYDDLDNKPKINNVTLSGNKSSSDLGLQDAISAEHPISASYVSGLARVATTGAYSDLTGLPTLGTAAAAAATDFATAAQGSKADAADTAISTAATGFASLDARLDSMDTAISGKQGALSSTQLDAVNSGIDSTKVQQIATNTTAISGKQDTLTTAQLAAANSGITSAGVAQIETNKTNILSAYGGTVGKNMLNTVITEANPHDGLTFTLNADKSITVDGTNPYSSVQIPIQLGNMTLTAGVTYVCKGTGDSNIHVQIMAGASLVANSSDDVTFTAQANTSYSARIWVTAKPASGTQFNNLTIYPMVCEQSLYTADSSYQQYICDNAELTTNISLLQKAHVSQTFVFPDLTWTATGGGVYVSNGTSITGIDKIESIVITGFNNIRTTDIISAITTNDRKQVRFMSNVTTFAHNNSGFDLYITGTPSNS